MSSRIPRPTVTMSPPERTPRPAGKAYVFYPGRSEVRHMETLSCGCVALRKLCRDHANSELEDQALRNEWVATARSLSPAIDDLDPLGLKQAYVPTHCFLPPEDPVTVMCLEELTCRCIYLLKLCQRHRREKVT